MSKVNTVDLLRPLLPTADKIEPYLKRIDQARWYSNLGPLVEEVKERTAKHFNVQYDAVITCSSATSGLTSVLRAMNLPRDSYCLVPSWTFVATPASAIAAEMIPYFVDVDEETWALDPDSIRDIIRNIDGVIGAIIVVAPFGKQIDLGAWQKFSSDTSIPVIIDAAAGFDSFRNAEFNNIPVVFSLHATKILGCGEGGLVISRDHGFMRHVQEQTNFGFYTRHISTPGVNAKMSEYSAAVALAALDIWPTRRKEWQETTNKYLDALEPIAKEHGLTIWLDRDNLSPTCNIRLPEKNAEKIISNLKIRGVKARQWWDKGCHTQPAYAKYPKQDLTITNIFAESVISLPFFVDLPAASIEYVAEQLAEVMAA